MKRFILWLLAMRRLAGIVWNTETLFCCCITNTQGEGTRFRIVMINWPLHLHKLGSHVARTCDTFIAEHFGYREQA